MTLIEYITVRLWLMLRRRALAWLLASDERMAIALYASNTANQPRAWGGEAKPFDAEAAMLKGTGLSDEDVANNPLLWRTQEQQDEYERVRDQLDTGNFGYAMEEQSVEALGRTFPSATEFRRFQARRAFEMRQQGASRQSIARALHMTVDEVIEDENRYLDPEQ